LVGVFIVELVVTVSVETWFCDKSQGTVPLVIVNAVAAKLCALVYCWAVFRTATLVPTVADPVLIVTSPVRVVVKLPIVPVVLLSVVTVPDVKMPAVPVVVPAVRVGIVPVVIVAAVDVVVPAVRVGIVAFVIVPVVTPIVPIVAVLVDRTLPVAVP
jgi:hypothetical protein